MYTDILKNEHWNYNNYPQQISKNYLSDGGLIGMNLLILSKNL